MLLTYRLLTNSSSSKTIINPLKTKYYKRTQSVPRCNTLHVGYKNQTVNKVKGKIQFWCDFDRASSLICGNKMPTICNRGFYCRSYCLLNMFRAPICPSSGAQEYYTVAAACGISCCKNVKNNFVSFVEFAFSVLSVVCYLGLLLGVSNVVGAVCGCSW